VTFPISNRAQFKSLSNKFGSERTSEPIFGQIVIEAALPEGDIHCRSKTQEQSMRRARRLKQIADSFRPAFESTTGTHWWLADVQSKPEPVLPASFAMTSTTPAPASVRASSGESATSPALAHSFECGTPGLRVAAASHVEPIASLDDGPTYSFADTFEEKLTWDSRASCFVRA
jgi:hypothetical protein